MENAKIQVEVLQASVAPCGAIRGRTSRDGLGSSRPWFRPPAGAWYLLVPPMDLHTLTWVRRLARAANSSGDDPDGDAPFPFLSSIHIKNLEDKKHILSCNV